MTLIEERPPSYAEGRYTRRAWIAAGLIPLGLAVGIVVSFMGQGAGPGLGGALVGLLALAAPTASIALAAAAVRAHEPSGKTALIVSVPLFVATAGLLLLVAISLNALLVALATAVIVLAIFGWRFRR